MYKAIEIIDEFDITYDFHDLSNEKIQKFQNWFVENKPSRKQYLINEVFNGNSSINESNLKILETFLINNVFSSKKDKLQIEYENSLIPDKFKDIASADEYILTNYTKSVCFDLGLIVGEWIIELESEVKWRFENNFNMVFYGNAILYRKGCKAGWCPFHIMRNFASKVVEKKYEEGMLNRSIKSLMKSYNVENSI